jgi:hypothetical protein
LTTTILKFAEILMSEMRAKHWEVIWPPPKGTLQAIVFGRLKLQMIPLGVIKHGRGNGDMMTVSWK